MNLAYPPAPNLSAPALAVESESTATPARILVLDDDEMLRELLTKGLRRATYHVSTANNGEAGWEALCAENFDLLITDHEMPRLTGLNLLRRIRLGARQVPVILMSGNLPWEEPDLRPLLAPGVAMQKPFFLVEMLTNIRRLLGISRLSAVQRGSAPENFTGVGSVSPG